MSPDPKQASLFGNIGRLLLRSFYRLPFNFNSSSLQPSLYTCLCLLPQYPVFPLLTIFNHQQFYKPTTSGGFGSIKQAIVRRAPLRVERFPESVRFIKTEDKPRVKWWIMGHLELKLCRTPSRAVQLSGWKGRKAIDVKTHAADVIGRLATVKTPGRATRDVSHPPNP